LLLWDTFGDGVANVIVEKKTDYDQTTVKSFQGIAAYMQSFIFHILLGTWNYINKVLWTRIKYVLKPRVNGSKLYESDVNDGNSDSEKKTSAGLKRS